MLKLHGAPMSNYYNMAKSALLEKGMEFEEVLAPPSREPEYLAKSAMGKIPCLQTDDGFLAETGVILDYLEETHPEAPLLPVDPYARAKVKELGQSLALYIDTPARRGLRRNVSDEDLGFIKKDLEKGVTAIRQLAKFTPWIAGEEFTSADLVGYFAFGLANMVARRSFDLDLLAAIEGAQAWYQKVGERPSVQKVLADQAAARAPQS